jgi:cytidylate kinase
MILNLKERAFDFKNRFVVALDGPSASGKGTIGQMLAKILGLKYFQSSIVYRGLALMCINQGISLDNRPKIISLSKSPSIIEYAQNIDLNDENIADVASKIATIPEVRENLGVHLIKLIENTHRIIMEGRDIATVIAPNADLKIFITADVNTRAERRYKQLHAKGKKYILSEILNQLKARDIRDQERDVAPLVPAKDSLVIDTSNLAPEQVVEKIQEFIH